MYNKMCVCNAYNIHMPNYMENFRTSKTNHVGKPKLNLPTSQQTKQKIVIACSELGGGRGHGPDKAIRELSRQSGKFCILMGFTMQVHHLSEPMVSTPMTNIGHVTVLPQPIPTAAHKYFLYTTGS